MPIYMDRHDVSEDVTAESVAQLHQADLKIQHKFDCRGLTYWFDDIRKTAFCLVEAPDQNSIIEMHKNAHGQVPHQIIEVDAKVVESFLGRIEDPEKSNDAHLNVINDPAFRVLMFVSIEHHSFKNSNPFKNISNVRQFYKRINVILKSFEGSIACQDEDGCLVTFRSVAKAVQCALRIREDYRIFRRQYQLGYTELSMGLHAGVPVTEKKSLFEDTIKLARNMCAACMAEIVVSAGVQRLFAIENVEAVLNMPRIHVLTPAEEKFLNRLMEFTQQNWQNGELKVEDFERNIGVSKSKLYREMIRLTGKSPNVFLLHYRLRKSLQQLMRQEDSISEIAFDSGFKNPSYYSRCFRKKYGVIPSALIPQ